MVAIIGGSFSCFRSLIDLYRGAGARAGHAAEALKVGVHVMGFVGETDSAARAAFFPGWFAMVSKLGRERVLPETSRQQFDAMYGPHGAFLVGDPRTVATKALTAQRDLDGICRLTFQMGSAAHDTEAMLNSIELLGHEVKPLVNGGGLSGRMLETLQS